MKIRDFKDPDQLPVDNPYRVWKREKEVVQEARQATWDAWSEESRRWREESGHDAAFAEGKRSSRRSMR